MNRYKLQLETRDDVMITDRTAQRYRHVNRRSFEQQVMNASNDSIETISHDIVDVSEVILEPQIQPNELDSHHLSSDIEMQEIVDSIAESTVPTYRDIILEDEEENYFQTAINSFQDFINSDNFLEPINTPVDISIGDLFIMILKYSTTNSLPVSGMTNLFKLVNSIFQSPVLPNSKYILDLLLNSNEGVRFHAVCENCSMYIGEFSQVKNVKFCTNCQNDLDLSNPCNKSFFVMINPSEQISDLLKTYENHYSYVVEERVHTRGVIEDIYDGKKYREFVKNLPKNHRFNYVTSTLNTDGANKFESSQYSIWPIYLMLNELPAQERMNHLVVCGLWFNRQKPDMSIFLDTFVDLVDKTSKTGISCTIKNTNRTVYHYVLKCCVDSVARAPIQGVKQFNGNYGCNWCLHPGNYIVDSMKYPILAVSPLPRDHQTTVNDMLFLGYASKHEKKKKTEETGIKSPSPLMNLSLFDIIYGFNPDYMHCILEGVAKQVTNYHLQPLSDDQLEEMDEKLRQITAPHQIGRLTRDISKRHLWKAREWENYVLYYSIPVLSTYISSTLLDHWRLLVESLYILLQQSINIVDLNKAQKMLFTFIAKCEEYFGLHSMTYNMHLLTHISESVLNWGPLWSQSTFCFESANHNLLKAIKCSKGVTSQIVRLININHKMLLLQEFLYPSSSALLKIYCDDILGRTTKHTYKISEFTYFGKGNAVDNRYINDFHLSNNSLFFRKMIKNNCLYESNIKEKKRSNNSYAQLDDNTFINIIGFIVDSDINQELTLCKILRTRNVLSNSYEKIQSVYDIDQQCSIVHTSQIRVICVAMEVNGIMYVCPIPNLYHY